MKKFLVIFAVFSILAVILTGCSDPMRGLLTSTETPQSVVAIVNGNGVLCSDNIYVTYITHTVLDSYSCNQDGVTVNSTGNQQVTGIVTVSNFKPAVGEQVTVTYKFTKFDQGAQSNLNACEISTENQLHEQSTTGQFVITADKKATYVISCPNGDTSIEAEFTLRTGE